MLKFLGAAAFALSTLVSLPAFADTMAGSSDACASASIHSVATSTSSQIGAVKTTGDADKDYAALMAVLTKSARDLSSWEMKCGKSSKTMKMAEKAHAAFGSSYNDFTALTLGG